MLREKGGFCVEPPFLVYTNDRQRYLRTTAELFYDSISTHKGKGNRVFQPGKVVAALRFCKQKPCLVAKHAPLTAFVDENAAKIN